MCFISLRGILRLILQQVDFDIIVALDGRPTLQ